MQRLRQKRIICASIFSNFFVNRHVLDIIKQVTVQVIKKRVTHAFAHKVTQTLYGFLASTQTCALGFSDTC